MIYVVLGMHKSGTTLVSELLHQSGISMVEVFDTEKDYYSGNKVERASTLSLNQDILDSKQVFSLDISTNISQLRLEPAQRIRMQRIVEECSDKNEDWGFKDPRTSITYSLWQKILPNHKIIVVYRHPFQVLNHYRRRVGVIQRWARAKQAYKKWTETNIKILEVIESTDYPLLVINYHDLIDDDNSFQQLSDFVDRPLKDIRKVTKHSERNPDLMFKLIDLFSKRKGMNVFRLLETYKLA